MSNAGVIGGNEVFQDRETGSRWQQSSLQAISGPLKGERLELYPFLLTDWKEWRRLHPDTLVLKPLPGYADRIPEKNEMIRRGLSGEGSAPPGVLRVDDRLKPRTMVLGLDLGESSEAFPLAVLREPASFRTISAASQSSSSISRHPTPPPPSLRARKGKLCNSAPPTLTRPYSRIRRPARIGTPTGSAFPVR